MAIQTLTVDGNGNTTSGWAAEGGDYTRVQSDDGDTTRLYTPTINDVRQFSLTDTVDLTGATINSVTVYAKYRSLDPVANTFQIGVRAGSTDYWSASKNTVNVTTYILFSETWTTNPNTTAAWTVSDLDALQVGVKKINNVGGAVTYVYAEVDYTAAAGGTTVTPTTASLTLSTFTPTVSVSDHKTVTPSTLSLTISTFAPTVSVSDNQSVTPTTTSLTLTLFAPTVSVTSNQTVTPGTASLTTTAFAPTVLASDNKSVTPATLSLTLTTFAPTVTVEDPGLVSPNPASLTLTTFAPTVTYSVVARKYYIDSNANIYWVINQDIGLVEKV